jgi:hypothetical protein
LIENFAAAGLFFASSVGNFQHRQSIQSTLQIAICLDISKNSPNPGEMALKEIGFFTPCYVAVSVWISYFNIKFKYTHIMLRKVLIGLGILAVVLTALFLYANYRNRSLSPSGTAELDIDGLHIAVSYSRPSVRGRVIFGTEDEEALLPYGSYWRLGANEATEITFSKDVTFNGVPLKAGSYSLYAVPGAEFFKIGVNSETGNWGAWEPDYSKDVMVTEVPVTRPVVPVEQFTTRIEAGPEVGALLYFEWSNVQLIIPVVPAKE